MDEPERRILSLDQTEALLDAGKKFGGGRRWAYFAMACLSGLRREEILRLSPDQVNLSEGYILAPAIKSKTRRRDRFCTIFPRLAEILRKADLAASLRQENFRREFDAIRMLADLADDWQDDVMRHSFGSYHLDAFGDENLTAREMGNSPEVIYSRYYRRVGKPGEGKEFLGLEEASEKANKKQMKMAAKA